MSPAKGTARTKPCTQCGAQMRPFAARKEDWPNTKARATSRLCSSCWGRAYKRKPAGPSAADLPVAGPDDPSVLVRTDLRPSTYKRIAEVARNRGITPGDLLSMIADAAVNGRKP